MATAKPAVHAVERLIAGNDRFVEEVERTFGQVRAESLLSTQKPFAVVLACADSRVVPELIFDQSVGRLFVIRVAGNVAGPAELGSIEYAVDRFGCPVVLVLGHTQCGAVSLAMPEPVDDWEPSAVVAASPGVNAILDSIRGSLDPLTEAEPLAADDEWERAVRQNVRSVVEVIARSPVANAEASGAKQIAILGAVYDVRSGRVTFLDE